jgi:serine protease Do
MRVRKLWILCFFLIVFCFSIRAQSENSRRLYPLPLVELEKVLRRWLIDSDYQVSRSTGEAGEVLLMASNERESCQFSLKPHSALATEVLSTCSLWNHGDLALEEEVRTYLMTYARDALSEEEVEDQNAPIAVLSNKESVVCIGARLENEQIQFSGFIIDPEGLIISTAHDLKRIQEIRVTMHDGREFKGYLLKKDPYRDLALIDIRAKVNSAISLSEGRNLLRDGERLFSIACASNLKEAIHSATVNGPPRRMDNLPLWQATMKTLPGSSGSPVFDLQGNVVAIVKGRYRGTDSVGFLTPLGTILEFLEEVYMQ